MMHDYQKRAVEFALAKDASYMAIDMGLGKTRIALEWASKIYGPTLVLAPLRVCQTSWPQEVKKWGYSSKYAILHGAEKLNILKNIASYELVFVPYSSLKWLFNVLTSQNIKGQKWVNMNLVIDEASFVKSHSTKRFAWLKKMKPLLTRRRLALSATPSPQGLDDLWSQYYLLDQGTCLGKNITAFRDKYCRSISYPGMPVTLYVVRDEMVEEIHKAIAPITFRLEAKDYLTMPEIVYNFIPVELPDSVMKQYLELEKNMLLELNESTVVSSTHAATLSGKLRQLIQGGLYTHDEMTGKRTGCHILHEAKLEALKEVVEAASGKPIICAIQFKFELDMIRQAFPNAPYASEEDAMDLVDRWNAGKIPLLLCHPQSLAHGVNMQEGGYMLIWYGLTWSLEQYIQLIGRLWRQGQKHTVIIHHLMALGTIDELVKQAIEDKATTQNSLLQYLKEYKHGRSGI